jgi:hypothetical protein
VCLPGRLWGGSTTERRTRVGNCGLQPPGRRQVRCPRAACSHQVVHRASGRYLRPGMCLCGHGRDDAGWACHGVQTRSVRPFQQSPLQFTQGADYNLHGKLARARAYVVKLWGVGMADHPLLAIIESGQLIRACRHSHSHGKSYLDKPELFYTDQELCCAPTTSEQSSPAAKGDVRRLQEDQALVSPIESARPPQRPSKLSRRAISSTRVPATISPKRT